MEIKKRLSNLKGHTESFLSKLIKNPEVQEHNLTHPLKGLLQHVGSLQFVERLSGFLVFFMLEVLLIKIFVDFGHSKIDLVKILLIPQRTPLFILITAMVFLVIARYRLFDLENIDPFSFKRFFTFFIINLAAFFFFFKLNIFMTQNPETVLASPFLFMSAWYASAIALTGTLFLAFFRNKYIFKFGKKFTKPIVFSSVISLIFLYTFPLLEKYWLTFSTVVGKAAFHILNIFYPVQLTFMPDKAPIIAMPNFKATIASQCSGIEGITLFIFLFTLLLILDWKIISKKKALFLYLIGIGGVFLLNILRITSLFIMGQIYSPQFAIGFFHSNAGWILFASYFVLFEFITYDRLRKKNDQKFELTTYDQEENDKN